MGSGTTVGEALKLGCRAVGVDINPVSYFQVKKALEPCSEAALCAGFLRLEREVAPEIKRYYKSRYEGIVADLLYTFWVKTLPCPSCEAKTRLFNTWIFSSNAYPKRKPQSLALCPQCGDKVYGLNRPLKPILAVSFEEITAQTADVLLLSEDASRLPLPSASVDLVVTDPPYFDNVHYSELTDFFFAWLKMGLGDSDPAFRRETSRSGREVQGKDAEEFGALLGGVFKECARVLKVGGTLAFTFHHSREEAWLAVASAIEQAGLEVVAAHPVKAEMSVAVPKSQAKEPINLDSGRQRFSRK